MAGDSDASSDPEEGLSSPADERSQSDEESTVDETPSETGEPRAEPNSGDGATDTEDPDVTVDETAPESGDTTHEDSSPAEEPAPVEDPSLEHDPYPEQDPYPEEDPYLEDDPHYEEHHHLDGEPGHPHKESPDSDVPGGDPHAADPAAAGEPTSTDTAPTSATAEDTLADDWEDGDSWLDAPESDEERPLVEHLDEMFRRAAVVLVVLGVGTALALPTAEFFITFLWDSLLPAGRSPRIYGPLELVLTELKVAALVGFVLALPALVYESYLFMRPGLYPHERRYYLASVPTSLVLALVGIVFSYAVVLPVVFGYFTGYTQPAAEVAFGLKATFDLILIMLGWFALIFQIPLFVMLAIMMGLTSRQWLESQRVYFWGAFLGVAFLFSPDPTGMAPVMVAATMVGLFEGTLLLLRWTSGETGPLSVSALLAVRPAAWLAALALGYLVSPLPAPSGYYSALPAVMTRAVETVGVRASLPVLVGGGLIALYEALGLIARRTGAARRLRLALARLRVPAWLLAIVLGSLAAPEPVALARIGAVDLDPAVALLLALALVTGYEALLAWSRRRREGGE